MDRIDQQVRLAAFRFLEDQLRRAGEDGVLRYATLRQGFVHDGQRVPLVSPQGIFKPRVLPEVPLSIRTVAVVEGETPPYDDAFGGDGLLRYRYRGQDLGHRDNVGLRLAMTRQTPLIYFHGIVPGLYVPEWPVFIVGDDPARLTFTVSVEERRFATLGTTDQDDSANRRFAVDTQLARFGSACISASSGSASCAPISTTAQCAGCAATSYSKPRTSYPMWIREVWLRCRTVWPCAHSTTRPLIGT